MQQLRSWKRALAEAPPLQTATPSPDPALLVNRLPNSGGLVLDAAAMRPREIFDGNRADPGKRSAKIEGFEGVALDDALNWLEEYRHFSFVPLASTVAQIARSEVGKPRFSVLELGFGSGGFRPLVERFGAVGYLGLDANPLPMMYSPHVRQRPDAYRTVNLHERIDFGHWFDVVCSFEVLEHIREDYLDELLGTIRTHMGPKSVFVGTASIDDSFDVHITVHPKEWWLERFARFGLVPVEHEATLVETLFRSAPHNWSRTTSSAFVLRVAA